MMTVEAAHQNLKLGFIDVLHPPEIEVDTFLTDLVGHILRTYILEDKLSEAQLDVLIKVAQMLCLNIETVKHGILMKGHYQKWQSEIASNLNDHALNNVALYENLSYLRTDVTKTKGWLLFMIVVICQYHEVSANKVGLDQHYIMRFCENVVSTIFSNSTINT